MSRREFRSARLIILIALALWFIILACETATDTAPRPWSEQDNAASLIEAYDCWTGEAPGGKVAEFALLGDDDPDTNAVRVSTQREFDLAIEQEVYGLDHGLRVYAFCPATSKESS